jgi:hypothetical protein
LARGGPDFRRALTLGGQAPLSVGALILAMLVLTALGGLLRGTTGLLWLLVTPGDLVGALLEPWRLVTWPFPQPLDALVVLNLLFAGVSLLWLGRQLSFAWSERRFLARFFTLTVGTAVATHLVLWPFGTGLAYAGMWPIINALLVTWGLIFPRQQLSWFGAVQLSGAGVARLFTFGTPLYALVTGHSGFIPARLLEFTPHLAAVALAWLLVAGGPRRVLYRLSDWWERRRLRDQRRKFKVVGTDDKPPRQWIN